MGKLEAMLEARLEAVLDKALGEVIDRALTNAIDRIITKALGLEVEAPKPEAPKSKAPKSKAKAEAPKAEVKAEALKPEARLEAPKPEPEDILMARLEARSEALGEKYGPMLMRRAKSIKAHALNPAGALAVLTGWVESTPPEEVIAVLRGSEKLPSGEVLSGWRYLVVKLGIPVKP